MGLFSVFPLAVYVAFYWHLSQYFNTLFKCVLFYAFSTWHLSKAFYALNICFIKNEWINEDINNRNSLPWCNHPGSLGTFKMAPRHSMSSIEWKIENRWTKTFFQNHLLTWISYRTVFLVRWVYVQHKNDSQGTSGIHISVPSYCKDSECSNRATPETCSYDFSQWTIFLLKVHILKF